MKTKQELQQLKKEYESLTSKLLELSEDEIVEIVGGFNFDIDNDQPIYEQHLYENIVNKEKFEKKL